MVFWGEQMTAEDAYTWINVHMGPKGDWSRHDAAVKTALDALQKQTPQKPYRNRIEYPNMRDMDVVQCPSCRRRLRTTRTQKSGDRYCPACGQAIDWEDDDGQEKVQAVGSGKQAQQSGSLDTGKGAL